MNNRTILIADADINNIKQLGNVLKEDGYKVLAAKDGSKSLEQAILNNPDLIIIDENCPLINANKFRKILRTNPRTEDIPLVVMVHSDSPTDRVHGYLEGSVKKPFNPQEVRSYIAGILHKLATAEEVQQENEAISGSLRQMALVDLLQIFSMNRKNGRLHLTDTQNNEGSIFIEDGTLIAAQCGRVEGSKALYRLLRWPNGDFTFIPGHKPGKQNLTGSTDSHIMEGLRQSDELDRILPDCPSETSRLTLAVPAESLPEGLHPVTAELISLLAYRQKVSDIIDMVNATDLEAYQALAGLLSKEFVVLQANDTPIIEGPLLNQDELTDFRTRMRQMSLPPMYIDAPKIALLFADMHDQELFIKALSQQELINLSHDHTKLWGTIGTMPLSRDVLLHYIIIPVHERMLPLLNPIGLGCIGSLICSENISQELRASLKENLLAPLINLSASTNPIAGEYSLPIENFENYGQSIRDILHTFLTRIACQVQAENPEAM